MKTKKILFGVLSLLCLFFSFLLLTACDKEEALAIRPTEQYVIECLEKIPDITEIKAATETNDPNGNLNKSGGYTAHVFFSLDVINQEDVHGDNLIDKGTDAGGSVEVYQSKKDAKKRNEYLSVFDGGILASGSHTVYGTCVIRTSSELMATFQKITEANIINALSGKDELITKLCPNHNWDNGITIKEADCTSQGSMLYKCELCGKIKYEYIEAKGHNEVVLSRVEPTCIETGLTEGKYCYRCGQTIVHQNIIPEVGHEYVNSICIHCKCSYYTKGLLFEICYPKDNSEPYAIVTGYFGLVSYDVTIPKYYEGHLVKEIGTKAFIWCDSLERVEIPNSVKSIGDDAFYGCSSLTSITIPNSVKTIGDDAFSGCESLTSIVIPEGVTSIGKWAFSVCSSLTSVTIPDSITCFGNDPFNGCTLKKVKMPTKAISYIPKESLKTVAITSGSSIPDKAFQGCYSLTSITIPNSVNSIGAYAFSGCSSLTTVYYTGTALQWNYTYINSSGNSSLTNATIIYNYVEE